jgi:two-component system OmpR family sensor kinase
VNWPIRLRLTVTWVVMSTVVTAVGALLFWGSVQGGLANNRDEHLRSRTVRLAAQVGRDGADSVHARTPTGADGLVELIGPDGQVARSSPDLPAGRLLDDGALAFASRTGGFFTVGSGPDYRLYAAPAPTPAGTWVVITATPLQAQNELSAAVTRTLVIAAGLAVVIGSVGAWFLAGASLRPVERLRRDVATISETDPSGSVHVPATRDELATLAVTMNDLLARIAGGLARQRQFVADASHEVRTPLANLRTTLELAGMPGRGLDDVVEAVRLSEAEVIRLSRIVDDMLVLAAADDAVPIDHMPRQPIRPMLEATIRAATPAAEAAGVELRVEAPTGLTAACHGGRVRQVLDNLVSNALRYAPAGSQVLLAAYEDGSCLVLEAVDDGPGFPAGFAEHAFDRFRRADSGNGGTGLGLAVVRAIAEAHGGAASAANRPTGGAVVRVRIPLHTNASGG